MPYPPSGPIQPNGPPLNASPVPGQQTQPPPPTAMGIPQHFKTQPAGMDPSAGQNTAPANGIPPPGQPISSRAGPPQPIPGSVPGQQIGYQSQQFVGSRPPGSASHPPVSAGPPAGQFQPQFSNPVMNGPSHFQAPSSLGNQPPGQFPPNTSVNRFQAQPPPSSQQSTGRTDSPQGRMMAPSQGMVQTSQQAVASTAQQVIQSVPQGGIPTSLGSSPAQSPPRMPQNPPQGGVVAPPGMSAPYQQGGPRLPQSRMPLPMTSAGPPQSSSFPSPPRAGFPPSSMPGPPPQTGANQMAAGGDLPKADMSPNMPQGHGTS